jgi:endonuclease-3
VRREGAAGADAQPALPADALRRLALETRRGRYAEAPVYQSSAERTPFQVLAGCLVSQRVRDEQTIRICADLFAVAPTPEALLRLSEARLQRILRPAGFWRQKAKQLRGIAHAVAEQGGVPHTREGLVALPGIGPKCANIVLASAFGAPVIAIDTHVHRISNRMGWVRTSTPEKTEGALTPLVPVRWRRRVNALLVAHGQVICRPRSPRCDVCPVAAQCARRGVA